MNKGNNKNNTSFGEGVVKRVDRMELVMGKLAQGQAVSFDILQDLSDIITNDVRHQLKEEVAIQGAKLKQEVETDIVDIKGDLEVLNEKTRFKAIDRHQVAYIAGKRKSRCFGLVGGMNTPEYTIFYGVYMGKLNKDIHKKFKVSAVCDVSQSEYLEVLDFIKNWDVEPWFDNWYIDKILKPSYYAGELKSKDMKALKSILDI